jgi:hypothetical protein
MDLTLNELELAINFWRRLRPSTGDERALSAEVNTLANVYALMIYEHARTCPLATLDSATRALIDAWREAGGSAAS